MSDALHMLMADMLIASYRYRLALIEANAYLEKKKRFGCATSNHRPIGLLTQ